MIPTNRLLVKLDDLHKRKSKGGLHLPVISDFLQISDEAIADLKIVEPTFEESQKWYEKHRIEMERSGVQQAGNNTGKIVYIPKKLQNCNLQVDDTIHFDLSVLDKIIRTGEPYQKTKDGVFIFVDLSSVLAYKRNGEWQSYDDNIFVKQYIQKWQGNLYANVPIEGVIEVVLPSEHYKVGQILACRTGFGFRTTIDEVEYTVYKKDFILGHYASVEETP